MTTYESNLTSEKRIEYFKSEILWHTDHPSALSATLIEIDTAKLKGEIGEVETERFFDSLKTKELVSL